MITSVFSVYDSKTAAYMPPFYMLTKPAAIRAVTDTVQNPEHQFYKHASDYSLFYLGTYCDQTSKFDMEPAPVNLCGLHELQSIDSQPSQHAVKTHNDLERSLNNG